MKMITKQENALPGYFPDISRKWCDFAKVITCRTFFLVIRLFDSNIEQLIITKRESVKLKESTKAQSQSQLAVAILFNVDLLYLSPTV